MACLAFWEDAGPLGLVWIASDGSVDLLLFQCATMWEDA